MCSVGGKFKNKKLYGFNKYLDYYCKYLSIVCNISEV